MADPKPSPKAPVKSFDTIPPMNRLVSPTGEEVYVPDDSRFQYIDAGYKPAEEMPVAGGEAPGALDYALGAGEQFLAGASMGLSSGVADVLAGGANVLAETAGYQGPRAAGPGLDATLLPEDSGFIRGMQGQQAKRGERAEALGPVLSTGLQVAGGLATLGAGGGPVGSVVTAPNLLVNRLGQRVAAKVIGENAVKAGLAAAATRAAGAAVGAGVEGAIGGGVSAAAESLPQIIENPEEAVKDIGVSAGYGAALGSAFGGVLGMAGEAAKALGDRAAARAAVLDQQQALTPTRREVLDPVAAAPELEARANTLGSQLPAEQRGLAETFLKNANALARENEVIPASIREATAEASALKANEDMLNEIAGIRGKREFNREFFEGAAGEGLTDELAPEDAALLGERQLRRTEAQAAADALTSQIEAAQAAANEARGAQALARTALDEAGDPAFVPSKGARARMKQMGLTGLGDSDMPGAQARLASRIAELEAQLTPPKPAEPPPMTVKSRATFPDGTKGVLYDVPAASGKGSRGRASMDFPADSDLATVSTIELAKDQRGAGLGTRMYAQMFDDAAAEGRRFASDTQRAPDAQSWWEKQVKKGNAVYDADLDRFILNRRPLPGGPVVEAPAAAPAAPKVPSEKLAAELAELREIQRDLAKPSKGRAAELRKAFKASDDAAKKASSELERLMAEQKAAQAALAAADQELSSAPAPRKMTRVESESRKMMSELTAATEEFIGTVADKDAAAAQQLYNQIKAHSDKAREFFAKGDYEAAYNQIDQGLRASIADFANSTKSNAAEAFAQSIYSAPQSLLERSDLFGAAAERQKRINPSITKFMRNASDPAYKALWADGRGQPASGFGTAKHARSDTMAGLLQGLGQAGNETAEAGVKHGFSATAESQAVRAADLGPEAQAIARDSAERVQRIFDIMDNVSLAKRDAETVRGLLQSGQTTAGVIAMVGALVGSPSVALPAVAGRWLLGTVTRQKKALASNLLKGTSKLLSGAVKVAGPIGKAAIPAGFSAQQREKNLKHYREMMDPMSPTVRQAAESAQVLNEQSPGLGDAALKHEIEKAQYVHQFMPKPPSPAVFSPPAKNTDVANRRLDRVLAAVGAPGKAFDRIVSGRGTDEDLDAMRTLYPGPYQKMVDTIMEQVTANPGKVKNTSLQLYLSKVTGQPLTPSLMTLTRNQARAQAATAGVEDAGKPQGQGANGADGVTARPNMNLNVNEMYAGRADRVLAGA